MDMISKCERSMVYGESILSRTYIELNLRVNHLINVDNEFRIH